MVELYNLSKDISETTNLAEDNPKMVNKLKSRLEKYDASLKADK